jgi:glycerol-3-phosphate dehydrogenase (NAD+)
MHPETKKAVAPVELCPILKTLYKILIKRLEIVLTVNAVLGYNSNVMSGT